MGLVGKINKKYRYIQSNWEADIRFSKKYAKLRRKDIISSTIGLKNISDQASKQIEQYILNFLADTIHEVINKYKYLEISGDPVPDPPIFVCWWTGLESAPAIVKQCVKSIYKNAGKHPVNFITAKNYSDYISVPDFIIDKMKSGKMGLAHFADYLRVSILEKYGGLWLDATIYCSQLIPDSFFEYPFFTLKSPYTESRYLSKYQWVTFCLGGWRGNQFYSFMKEAFEEYWSKNDYAIDYLFFDYLIYLAKENCPYIRKLMDSVPENTPHRDDLQAAMNAALPAEQFSQVIQEDTEIYKLSWRETYSEKTNDGKQSLYAYFLDMEIL